MKMCVVQCLNSGENAHLFESYDPRTATDGSSGIRATASICSICFTPIYFSLYKTHWKFILELTVLDWIMEKKLRILQVPEKQKILLSIIIMNCHLVLVRVAREVW